MAYAVSVTCFVICFCLLHQVLQSGPPRRTRKGIILKKSCSRTCNKAREPLTVGKFQLHQCSCSQSCSTFGDCCYDAPYRVTKRSLHKTTDFICISVAGRGRYRAISGCPSGKVSHFCKDGLGYQPPVTSRKTNATYANRFCALCNGDGERLFTWNVELRCPTNDTAKQHAYLYGDFWSMRSDGVLGTRCDFYVHFNDFRSIARLELRPCTRTKKISQCSPSWTDETVLRLCRSYEDPVYVDHKLYRNIHCALCNHQEPESAECLPSRLKNIPLDGFADSEPYRRHKTPGHDAYYVESLLDLERGRPYTIADLVRLNDVPCARNSGRCCHGEAFDTISQSCREIEYD